MSPKQNYEQFRKVFSAPNLIITSLLAQQKFRDLREFMMNPPNIKLILIQDRDEDSPVRFRVEYSGGVKRKWLDALKTWCTELNKRTGYTLMLPFTWISDSNETDFYIEIDGDPTLAYNLIGTPKIAGKKNVNYEDEFPTKLRFYALGFFGDDSLTKDNWLTLEGMTPTQANNLFNKYVEEMKFPQEFCDEVFYPLTSEYLTAHKDREVEPPKHVQLALDWFYGQNDDDHHALFARWVHEHVDTSLPASCFAHLSKKDLIDIAVDFVDADDIDKIVKEYYQAEKVDSSPEIEDEENVQYEHNQQLKKEDVYMLKTRRIQLVHKWKVSSAVVAFLTDSEAYEMWLRFENGEIHDD